MLPGLGINTVDVSPDGKQIVFAAPERTTGKSRIWIAPVDRRRPPQVLPPAEGLGPVFEGGRWVIDLPPGRAFPDLPPDGWNSDADLANVRTVKFLDRSIGSAGLTASTYAYEKQFIQRNLVGIWLD